LFSIQIQMTCRTEGAGPDHHPQGRCTEPVTGWPLGGVAEAVGGRPDAAGPDALALTGPPPRVQPAAANASAATAAIAANGTVRRRIPVP